MKLCNKILGLLESSKLSAEHLSKGLKDVAQDIKRDEPKLSKFYNKLSSALVLAYPNREDVSEKDVFDLIKDTGIDKDFRGIKFKQEIALLFDQMS